MICGNGPPYRCSVGYYVSGETCTGDEFEDTQTCTACGNGGSQIVDQGQRLVLRAMELDPPTRRRAT